MTLSCLPNSQTRDDSSEHQNKPVSLLKGDTQEIVCDLGRSNKSTKFQTFLEVIRCELGRPKQSTTVIGIGPTKQWTPLYYAVYYNRVAALLHFLRTGQSPDGVADMGHSPLCVATAAGHTDIVKLLCEADADINAAVANSGEVALHIAIRLGRNDLTDTLLSYGPQLDMKTLDTRETPLHYAAAKAGSLATVVSLIKRGADFEALNAKGLSPAEVALQAHNLHAAVAIVSAARGNRRKLVKEKELLLKHVEKAQNRFSMNNELIGDIFEAGCPPDSTVLIEAIKRNDSSLVEMFLEKGADPNRASTSGLLPIFAALACSGSQIMHALVLHKADVTSKDQSDNTVLQGLFESPLAHDREVIAKLFEVLLCNGADPLIKYQDGSTLLHHAVVEGSGVPKIALLLVQRGVSVDEQNREGNTALHIAFGNRSCIAVLLKHGANTGIINKEGLSPLLYASKYATKEKDPDLEYLVKLSDICLVDSTGMTALHFAAQNGLLKATRALLQARPDTTVVDSKKRTPLLVAVFHQQWNVVPLLAAHPGANTWNEEGRTALHHIATSIPNNASTWKEIASATAAFCDKGVSRTLREKSGATPLILAIKSLPEEGLPVVEALLSRKGSERGNCVGHEDLAEHDALYYAATLGKPSFVSALLKNGSPFTLEEWIPGKGELQQDSVEGKQILKIMAEHEWLRRALLLQRQSMGGSNVSALPFLLPMDDLRYLLTMGLDPNSPPKSRITSPLLWSILNQISYQQPLPSEYLHDILKLVFEFGADPNAVATRNFGRTSQASGSQRAGLTIHPLHFLLEQSAEVDMALVHLFLDNGAKLSIPSTFFKGRYPLHPAVQNNRIDVVKLLIERGANVNCHDVNGRAPIHIAVDQNSPEAADVLIRAGTKIDIKDMMGNTSLHIAALKGNKRTISYLLHAGAKACKMNASGKTPLDLVPTDSPDKQRITELLKHAEEEERRMMTSTVTSSTSSSAISKTRPNKLSKPNPKTKNKTGYIRPPATPMTPQPFASTSSAMVPPPLNSTASMSKPSFEVEPALATPVRLSKQVVSIRYTPPTPETRLESSQKPRAVSDNASSSKPQQQTTGSHTRVDSSVNLSQVPDGRRVMSEGANAKAPVLDRKHTSFDRDDERAGGDGSEKGDELASWLAVSGALDKL